MDCTLAALIACFSWSGLFVDSGLSYQDAGIARYFYDNSGREYRSFNDTKNPYGSFSVGYSANLPNNVFFEFAASHESSINTNADRGINSVSVSVRWFPFR